MRSLISLLLMVQLMGALSPTSAFAGDVDRASARLRKKDKDADRAQDRAKRGPRRGRGGARGVGRRRRGVQQARVQRGEDALAGLAVGYLMFAPWTIPNLALTDHYPNYRGVPSQPYVEGQGMVDPSASPSNDLALRLGAQLTFRAGDSLVGALDARLDLKNRFAFAAGYRLFAQAVTDRPNRRWAGLGEVAILWRFAESPQIRFHTGVGYAQWLDRAGPLHGGMFYYSFEVYPVEPLSFGSQLAVGPVEQGYVLRWKSHLGIVVNHVEVQLAYDYLNVAGERLGGPMVGVQLHL